MGDVNSFDGTPEDRAAENDFELADNFSKRYGSDFRYTESLGQWRIWNGKHWEKDETLCIFDRVRDVCSDAAAVAYDPRALLRVSSGRTVDAVEKLTRYYKQRHSMTVDQWDADPWLLNTPGGVVDLHTGALRPAKREDYATKITAVAPWGECQQWLTFLSRITNDNKDLQDYLQCMCGYALTGVTREEAMFFLYGTGSNGKSKFLGAIAGIMGDYAKTAPIEMFAVSFNERHPTELARLQGARLVTATEPKEGGRWDEAKIKQITGGDRITARYMRQDFFEYIPQFKLLIAGNHKPALSSVDEAIRRRLNLLPFSVTIPESERDLELADKLRTEWGGILQWMIDGCSLWQSEGLQAPEKVRVASDDYFDNEDGFSQWLEDRCERNESCFASCADLFESWKWWCTDNVESEGSPKWFSQQLQSHGFIRTRTKDVRGFKGIRLK